LHRSGGFTLFETLVGLALATTVAAMGGVRLTELLATARLATASVETRFDAPGHTYELRDGSGTIEVHGLPRGVLFAVLPARSRIVFGALGTADNGTITLAAGSRSRNVVVNQRGRVRFP